MHCFPEHHCPTKNVGFTMASDLPRSGERKVATRRLILMMFLFLFIFISIQTVYFPRGKASCTEIGAACIVAHTEARVAKNNQGFVLAGYDNHSLRRRGFPPLSASYVSDSLKPRYKFKSYEEYVHLQLQKTLNPKLRSLWTSKDWRRKVNVFSSIFQNLMNESLLEASDKSLCIGARVGQEVLALKEIGVTKAIGVDLVPSPPLVVEGDMHRLPFEDDSFDFEFSNAYDHALFPALFASEVERTLKPGGIVVIHLALRQRPDKYSANNLSKVDPVLNLFKKFTVLRTKDIDAFGLDLEVVLRKPLPQAEKDEKQGKCATLEWKRLILTHAEPLIMSEPQKPWIVLKQNAEKITYLPNLIDICNFHRHVYIDVGARSYASSIGGWFVKKYPKQNQNFSIYAVEADSSFVNEYSKQKNVELLPFAAWVRNESLLFGPSAENRAVEGDIGMGKIQSRLTMGNSMNLLTLPSSREFRSVQGFDFAEWLLKNFSVDDFVVLKMDIEGAEFDLLPRMLETGAICLVDELFLECHYNRWQRTSPNRTTKYTRTYSECISLFQALRGTGVLVHQWW